jgi:Molybdenum cofactor biosynthesis enzyme
MIWKNKTHELDQFAADLMSANPQLKYYIFGAGLMGRELLSVFMKYNCTVMFIDNSVDKQRDGIDGTEVITLTEYLLRRDGQIIIAASKANTVTIKQQLEDNLLKHGEDFFLYDEFVDFIFPIISVYGFNQSYVSLAQITLTERCTLKCKKCAHGCSYVDNASAIDMTLQQVYKSADSFFSKVDFVKEFVLIGGEPLLYRELEIVIEYIGRRYRERISLFVITTNGTIIPNKDILKACQKYNILFRISNYSYQVPRLKKTYQRLMDVLESYSISYVLSEGEHEWMDYGFEYVNRNESEDELVKVFDACKTPCREIRENRFYYCVMARSISDNLGFHVGQDDYLDMDRLNGTDYRKELLEFTLGYSDKGYLDMCRHCNGAEAKNYPIPAAEQVIRNDA